MPPTSNVSERNQKLKSVPAKHPKNPQVVKLRDQATRLRRQGSRMRQSLEASSIRGDEFTPKELGQLQRHPVMRPMLANLVFTDGAAMGYAADGGRGADGVKSLQFAGHQLNPDRSHR